MNYHAPTIVQCALCFIAVGSILKPGGPNSKESASNEAFYNFCQKIGWTMAQPAHPLATTLIMLASSSSYSHFNRHKFS